MSQKLAPFDAWNNLPLWRRIFIKLDSCIYAISLPAVRFFFTIFFILIVAINWISISKEPEVALIFAGIWGLMVTFSGGNLLKDQGKDSTIKFLWMLPYSAECIYQKLKRQAIIASTASLIEFLIVYLAVTFSQVSFTLVMAAVLFAVIQWGITCCLTLAWMRTRINPQSFLIILFFLAFFLPLIGLYQPSVQHHVFVLHNIMNPLGWVNVAFFDGVHKQHGVALLSLLPALVLLAFLPRLEKAIHRMFHAGDFQNSIPASSFSLFIPKSGNSVFKMCEEGLSPVSLENQGWIERGLSKLLTKREKTVLEFQDIHRYKFSRSYGILWIGLICHGVIGWIATHYLVGFFPSMDRSRISLFIGCMWGEIVSCAAIIFSALFMGFFIGQTDLVQFQNRILSFASPRLFPISYWTTAKANIRVQTFLLLLMVIPALLFDLVPGIFSLFLDLPQTPFLAVKGLVCLWCGSIYMDAFSMRRRYPSQNLKYWIECAKQTGVLLSLVILACLTLDKESGFWSFLWGTLMAGETWIWLLYSATRYSKIPFIQFLRSTKAIRA